MYEFEDVIKSSDICCGAKDNNSKYIYCNELFAQKIGLDSPKQIFGKTDTDLFPKSFANVFQSGDAYVLKGGVLINSPELLPQGDKFIQIFTTKNQLKNKKGDVNGVVWSAADVVDVPNYFPLNKFIYDDKNNHYNFCIGMETEYFTASEYKVFKRILLGYTAKQIARKLDRSPRTIEAHIENIKNKLQCGYKNHIIEAAMRLGLV